MIKPSEISDILKKQLDEVDSKINFEEVGTVLEVGDGVAHVYGLENVRSSELIEFENGVHGVAMNLEESNVGVILLDNVDKVTENMTERAFADRYQGDRLYGSYRPWTERVDHRRPSNRENGYRHRYDYQSTR